MTTANGILFVSYPSTWLVRIHVGIWTSAVAKCFSVVYFTGRPQPFQDMQYMHTQSAAKALFQWVFTANSCGVATF